jgi:thiamine kinase
MPEIPQAHLHARGLPTASAVARLLVTHGIGVGPWEISAMTGGYWNQVFLASSAARQVILKCYQEVMNDSLFPNLPDAEVKALHRLSDLGVAPDPVAFWQDSGILVYEFVRGDLWEGDVAAVAQLLLRKERASGEGFRRVPCVPNEITGQGDALFSRCERDEMVNAICLVRPEPIDVPPPPKLSLIHTDIGATNLIGKGKALRLIDWQCPAEGDVVEDIYSFLSPAFQILNLRTPLDRSEISVFFGELDRPDLELRYMRLRPYLAYRMAGYCCIRLQTAAESEVCERYRHAAAAELRAISEYGD